MQVDEAVRIPSYDVELDGDLIIPPPARGLVVFAHGSGSGRHSPRNRAVAAGLRAHSLGTLLLDLLTPDEEEVDARTRRHRFDIELLASRLIDTVDWLAGRAGTAHLPIAYFGASTGAGAALVAAARHPARIASVVSRGGRPDLAADALEHVAAPTLLIVGGNDPVVLDLNREAAERLRVEHRIEIVPGATHLFEEPGALDDVTRLAGDWIERHLPDEAR